ncbi:hypothetical protein [Alkalibacillus aidingensis]|uniref:hypothetical protein n=1 Tax=Alkalibacillus aidingensis TaxID=2747607 RepID=UPI0016615144|nr:hypothetical protein [Alkalibacillus aidingensis]
MGYILPVNQHQYQNYHRRTIDEKQSSMTVDKVFRVELDRQRKWRHDYEQERKHRLLERERQRQSTLLMGSTDQLYPLNQTVVSHEMKGNWSHVTGKGQHFSETI